MSQAPNYPRCYGSHGHSGGLDCMTCQYAQSCKTTTENMESFKAELHNESDSVGPAARKAIKKLLDEIDSVVAPKLFNIAAGTASDREKQIVQECLGFKCLLEHSVLAISEIEKFWNKSNLKYM